MKTKIFEMITGAMLRGEFRRFLERQKSMQSKYIDISWRKSKGFLESSFFITVSDEPTMVDAWVSATKDMTDE
jgi:hypothetical protein